MTDTPLSDDVLLPCPFCGQQPEMEPWHGGAPTKVLISCVGLHPEAGFADCGPAPSVTGETPAEAAAAWNTRAALEAARYGEPAWQPIETAPVAMHFIAAYFYDEGGEWIYDITMLHRDHVCGTNEGSGPFTHWMPLPQPPSAVLSSIGASHDR